MSKPCNLIKTINAFAMSQSINCLSLINLCASHIYKNNESIFVVNLNSSWWVKTVRADEIKLFEKSPSVKQKPIEHSCGSNATK